MAARLGVQGVVYCAWERGESMPSLESRPAVYHEMGASAEPAAGRSLGERLKAWRTTRGLPQAVAARMAGMDVKTLGKIERSEYVSRASRAAVERLLAPPPAPSVVPAKP